MCLLQIVRDVAVAGFKALFCNHSHLPTTSPTLARPVLLATIKNLADIATLCVIVVADGAVCYMLHAFSLPFRHKWHSSVKCCACRVATVDVCHFLKENVA